MATVNIVDRNSEYDLSFIDFDALRRVVNRFYRGSRPVEIIFEHNRNGCYAYHTVVRGAHRIHVNLFECLRSWTDLKYTDDGRLEGAVRELTEVEVTMRVVVVVLHEIKHCKQYDRSPNTWHAGGSRRDIHNPTLAYNLSPLEAEAESWALARFEKAWNLYKERANV